MGYISHNAIVVASWQKDKLQLAAEKALDLGLQIVGPSETTTNGYTSMLVCPDGSKEGWPESDAGDKARAELRSWLKTQRYDDGSSPLEWTEIAFGSDDMATQVVEDEWSEKTTNSERDQ